MTAGCCFSHCGVSPHWFSSPWLPTSSGPIRCRRCRAWHCCSRKSCCVSTGESLIAAVYATALAGAAATLVALVMPNRFDHSEKDMIAAWRGQAPAPDSRLLFWGYNADRVLGGVLFQRPCGHDVRRCCRRGVVEQRDTGLHRLDAQRTQTPAAGGKRRVRGYRPLPEWARSSNPASRERRQYRRSVMAI